MSTIGTLYTVKGQGTGITILATAALGGVGLDVPPAEFSYEDLKAESFRAKFPHGKVPALETKDGFKLIESAAIARYIASLAPNSGLLGTNPQEAALVDQWYHFAEAEIDNYSSMINYLVKGLFQTYSKPMHTLFAERQLRSLNTLESHLSTRTFLVGERITLADIAIASFIKRAVTITIDAPLRAKLPNIIRHFETVVNQPKVKDIYGEIQYAEKAATYVPPPKEKKEKDPKPAAATAAPKAEKKPKAKPAADEDDDDEPLVPEEPKAKNPLDLLPKSTFNLEDWKRAYSNKDTRGAGGALEWFYQNFDKEGFSVWSVHFKYNEELTLIFKSSNQIGGFFNRLEASRKYLFGSVGVLGTANNSVISGVFILRGQDIMGVIDAAPDWESYDYKKLDLDDAAQKAFFEAALAWDLEIDGKTWADGKAFK